MRRLTWVWVWLIGVPVMFFVLALLVHAGQHGSGRWPYLLPLMASGVLGGILCAVLALSVTRHGTRPHESHEPVGAGEAEAQHA